MVNEFLLRGSENAIAINIIADALNLDVSVVKDIAKSECINGAPIMANCKGYYLATSKDEVCRKINRLRKQAAEIMKSKFAINNHAEAKKKSVELIKMADALDGVIRKGLDNEI